MLTDVVKVFFKYGFNILPDTINTNDDEFSDTGNFASLSALHE